MSIDATFTNSQIDITFGTDDLNIDTGTQIVREYIAPPSLPEGGNPGDLLAKRSDGNYDVEWITPADHAEGDNTRPITAAAVYTEIGNINALLAII